MGRKAYLYWAIAEITTAVFLFKGIASRFDVIGFLAAHGLTAVMTYMVFLHLIGGDRLLQPRMITKGFTFFLFSLCVVPLIGPAATLFCIFFLRFYALYPVRNESFVKVNKDVLLIMQKKFEGRVIPVTEAFLIRGLSRANALKMVAIVGEMDWSATKSGLLRYIIRLSPYQNVVLLAIDILNKKMDSILAEIALLTSSAPAGAANSRRLANLYHEIGLLDLCEPVMKPFYQKKSCDSALAAFKEGLAEDDALLSVKYLLTSDRVREAKEIYDKIRERGNYFFPKWITYEFELSVRLMDREIFNNLYLLIETAGGVFIPGKVKEAAQAWQKVLTSAWL